MTEICITIILLAVIAALVIVTGMSCKGIHFRYEHEVIKEQI